ncbi:hypothetical protein BZG02_07975 [Labilibaculum filiforme]|uniref:RagB/SusD family nutrient uptake outer membrane protein n=1 Tax=Labilibaculum filiforme TaxID=1940526 RepID=A0A2N3I0U2_9BACT|nr:RagB/SusD family nutrient uptake outer membrane protein [Labilibaculum filiforme]PKQ63940.1 hypothetical protein BZG02_07975 [Labilibaculum filiforme]
MKNKIFAILIGLTVFFTSCEDFLNEQPKGSFIPTEIEHFESLMLSTYTMQGRFSAGLVLMSDQVTGDAATLAANDANNIRRYLLTDFTDESLTESNEFWEWGYARIFVYNSIIEEADNKTIAGTEDELNTLVALARAARAFDYFDLVNAFGKSYNASTSSTDLSVPLVVLADVNAQIPDRATVKAVYDYMVQELTESLPYLPETRYYKTLMPGKDMAYALLSRIYLFMGEYDKAKENADLALGINSNIIDINNPFPTVIESQEVIYGKWRHNFLSRISYGRYGVGFAVAPDFASTFDADDRRLAVLTSGNTDGDGNLYLDPSESEFNIGLSVPELYLNRSECLARTAGSDVQDIIDDMNTIRSKRYVTGTYVDLTTTDIPDLTSALAFVLAERKRELAFRDIRLFDMRRLMVTGDYTQTLTRSFLGKDYSIAPNANNWYMNIPLKVMDFNPSWEQSPRDGVSLIN